MQLSQFPLTQILFFDIETVPLSSDFQSLTEEDKFLWDEKTRTIRNDQTPEEFYERAGIWAEFGKIVCISVGYFSVKDGREFRVRSFVGEERKILTDFADLLSRFFVKKNRFLCGHNAKEFDIPFVARRMVINKIPLPEPLNLFGKKPWEVAHLDTLELWKFGDYKSYISLKLLAHILGVPSPKDDIQGSEVRKVFYQDNDIQRIASYCEKDTIAVAQIFLRFKGDVLLTPNEIHYVSR